MASRHFTSDVPSTDPEPEKPYVEIVNDNVNIRKGPTTDLLIEYNKQTAWFSGKYDKVIN